MVRNLRLFVNTPTDTVPDELPNDGKTVAFNQFLNSSRDVHDPISCNGTRNRSV